MRETIEFRIPEEDAAEYLPPGTGELIGYGVRKLIVNAGDLLFFEIGRLHRAFRSQGKYLFSGREYHRHYSRRELDEAELFHVSPGRVFEPAGEECGTEYDESTACPECGAGATQVSELRLDLRKVPHRTDFAETIAGEQIVSQRLAECLIDARLQGFTLPRVLHKAKAGYV